MRKSDKSLLFCINISWGTRENYTTSSSYPWFNNPKSYLLELYNNILVFTHLCNNALQYYSNSAQLSCMRIIVIRTHSVCKLFSMCCFKVFWRNIYIKYSPSVWLKEVEVQAVCIDITLSVNISSEQGIIKITTCTILSFNKNYVKSVLFRLIK